MSEDELPQGWAETSLEELATAIQYGYTASADREAVGPRFLRITDIQDGIVDWAAVPGCEITKEDREKFSLTTGDIVFARTGATTGKSFLIRDCPAAVFASYLIRVRPSLATNSQFLSLCFQTPAYWSFITDNLAGNAQPNCNASKLAALPVPLPPIAEQRRIVEKVEALLAQVNAACTRLAKVPTILKRFRQSILSAACSGRLTEDWRETAGIIETAADLVASIGKQRQEEIGEARREADNLQPALRADLDLPELPESWQWVDLRFLMSPKEDFCYGVVQPGIDDPAGPRLIRVCDVERGHVSKSDLRGIPSSVHAQYARSVVRGGEILISVVGTIGRAAIVPAALAGANIARAVAKVPVREFDADYVCRWLATNQAELWMVGDAREVARKTLNLEQLRTLPVPLPPIPEQHEIVRRVDALFKLADAIEARVAAATARADKITQAILAKAFRGELVPTEAELARQEGRDYEPASALLARIRTARATNNNEKPTRHPRASAATPAPTTAKSARRKAII